MRACHHPKFVERMFLTKEESSVERNLYGAFSSFMSHAVDVLIVK